MAKTNRFVYNQIKYSKMIYNLTEYLGDHSKLGLSVAYVVNNGKILTTKS